MRIEDLVEEKLPVTLKNRHPNVREHLKLITVEYIEGIYTGKGTPFGVIGYKDSDGITHIDRLEKPLTEVFFSDMVIA